MFPVQEWMVDESHWVGEGQKVSGVRELHSADQSFPFLGPIFPYVTISPTHSVFLGLRVTGATTATMGPWGEPELLVWRPEAVAPESPVPVGLEVKLGALVLLLVLTLICSLVPICVLRQPGANPEGSGKALLFPAAMDAWGTEGSGTEEGDLRRGGQEQPLFGWGSGAWRGFICSFPSVLYSCPASRQRALSLVSCFAGGVFLATCLLDLLPDYLSAIDEALAALHVTVSTGWMHVTL